MAASELYTKHARVWLPDAAEVWKSAELIKDYTPGDLTLTVQLEDGTEVEHKIDPRTNNLPPLRNPNILVGENDLTALSYLHEPAVLHNLKVRFVDSKLIYTYCGIVLVAINPYESLPIYEADIINAYSGQNMGDMDPHIFAVAEEAYKQMARDEINQSIIVSGESGAGKTVSAKYAMRYFATVSCSFGDTSVEERVLASSPIMEALGNAKTTRNDNSSRFGKYIEIGFDKKHCIIGANMRTYLLEKSRVVFQVNFTGCADDFHCTNQGQSPVIDGVDDAKEMCNTRRAFSLLGIAESDQMAIYQIVAAILHLSNVEVKDQSADRSSIPPDDVHLMVFCELMGVPCEEMAHWLCHRKLQTTTETFVKPVSKMSAVNGRDALAKHIYARLFSWIVGSINSALKSAAKQHSFIGVLDIYGFETFDVNSFEQFCINYANEKLQQQFNLHVFKLEQEEYMKEEIPWTLIDFYDNQPCIDLIEAKLGVLDLLDEECKMPKGSDETWAQKLYNTLLKQNAHFNKPRLSNRAFIIHHFADKVEYQCCGFLDKNKDTINEEQINVMKKSKFDLLLMLFEDDEKPASSANKRTSVTGRAGPAQRDNKKTVGLQFRQSLHLLMATLNATTPHYVRCIKPNDNKAAFTLDPLRAVQQLRACGILETIRISAAGFPSRWTYQEFFNRYRVLMKQKDVLLDRKQTCRNLLETLIKDQDKYQFGKNKIFFRAGQVAYLEKLRSDKLRMACVRIQKTIRCWLARKKYLRMRESAITIQRHVRGHQARCYVKLLRRTRAAVLIQRNVRMWATRRRYQRLRSAAITIQCFVRAYIAKKQYYKLMFEQKAAVIQKWVRYWLARCQYRRTMAAIILLQSCVRRMRAKKELKKLKVEARSVEHFKKLNVGMENKILQLQHKINEQHKENRELSERLNVMEKTQTVEREKQSRDVENLRRSEEEARANAAQLPSLLEQLSFLQHELENIRKEKKDLEEQTNIYKEQTQQVVEELNMKNSLLNSEKDELSKVIQEQAQQLTEIKTNIENTQQMEKDLTEERSRYQSLLSEHLHLEERHRDLKEEMTLRHRKTRFIWCNTTGIAAVSSSKSGHKRTDSNYSSNSSEFSQSLGSTEGEDSPVQTEDEAVDLPVLLKLQRRVKKLEQEKHSLWQQLDKKEEAQQQKAKEVEEQRNAGRAALDLETLKRQQVESENKKLKQDLDELRKSLTGENSEMMPPAPGSLPYNTLLDQLSSSNEELEIRKEEVLLLRSHMVRQEALKHKDSAIGEGVRLDLDISSFQDVDRSTDIHTLNEDGELWLAYEGLKETNRLLEYQMQEQERVHNEKYNKLLEEVNKLRSDKEQQQKLLSQSLLLPEDARIEASLKHEITRLTNDNLEVMEQQEKQDKTIRKLKKQLKLYMKKVEDFEASAQQKNNAPVISTPVRTVNITRKEKEYQGMLEYRQNDVNRLLKHAVLDLKPRGVAVSLIPGLPAYIIFMCLRYADNVNDDQRVSTLLNSTITSIKGVIKRKGDDFEMVSFWLANTCRLMHCLKQYSGDEGSMAHNTAKQNEHCLTNFELSEYQQVFSDLAIQIYRQLIKCMEDILQPMIVASMLEHENIQGVLGSKPTGLRKRSTTFPEEGAVTLEVLLQRLGLFHNTMSQHGMDTDLIKQVVRQQFYIICAVTLNHLLLRKDMCSWSKGLQIRYNVWQLEEWLAERELIECGAKETLEPLIQAAQLLQIKKKTEADAQAICTMCTALTTAQIVKVLTLYTPVIEFEERVSTTFIATITYNRVWIPDAEHVWKSAEIVKDFHSGDNVLELCLEDGIELRHPVDPSEPRLPPLRNPDILVGENDLTALSYLHEPAVLHNLKVRFVESRIIYTYCGIILVAVNPYKQLHIYGDAIIHAYSGQNMGDMDPHIFAVAEEAYKQMARNHKNQSIIVSGESGAGKTVSARYAMRYFAVVSKSGSKTRVEDKVLASNPITEAIGNAKTTRNDNSSRFGKYTEISFDRRYQIIGANMRTYLLEKSRVVFQADDERNYHIFYQMCSCADLPEFKSLKLCECLHDEFCSAASADKFRYTCMGGEIRIEGVDDKKDMEETRRTFSLLGLQEDFQLDVFKVLAAILHLGNVEIRDSGGDKSSVPSSDPHLLVFCELLGVSMEGLVRWLCHRRIVLVAETVVKPVPKERAVNARDALAKQIYAHLFDCIINRINTALQVPGKQHAFIGVLDIYGFETFDINSFEQFCINYANEKLQQQFNLHVFKLEQEEYMKEDIPWTLIDFYDNQPVIDLIEAKMGILDLLDEECLFPQGTDQSWLQKLFSYLEANPLFEKPRLSNEAFVIQHFADKVEYQCRGFLEKNRDALYEELVDIMRVSKFPFLANFFQEEERSTVNSKGVKVRPARPGVKPANKQLRTSVGDKFCSSLSLLMETLNATTPHYVRCIKPNDEKLPFERVVQQLRACGVLETIRISAQSYPSRWTYIEFYSRYSILMLHQEADLSDKKQTCKNVLPRLIQDPNQYKFGRTKIFFRAGQVAYLEKLRLDRLRGACVTIQKHVRGWSERRKYLRMREAAIILQQYIRGKKTIRKTVSAATLRQGWAALVIQRHWRGYRMKQIYQVVRLASITIQAFTRGWMARKRYKKMMEEHKALVIQKYARAWLVRRRFQTMRRLVLNVQLSYRVQQLRKKIEEQNKENRGLMERLTSLATSHSQTVDRLQDLEVQLEKSTNQKASLEAREKKAKEDASLTNAQLQKEIDALNLEKQNLEKKFATSTKEAKESFDQIKRSIQEEKEYEARHRKIAENNIEIQRRDHEKEVETLKEEIKRLKEERVNLQRKIEEGGQVNSDLQEQVVQLTKHVKAIPELHRDLNNLQNQRNNMDRKMKQQSEEVRAKMNDITRQLLGGVVEEEVLLGLTPDNSEKIYEVEDLLEAFEGLQKATRILENHQREQKESYDTQVEGLKLKVDHLQKENSKLQNLFQEKSNVNQNIRQEVSRLSSENSVIPELKLQVSELQRQKQDLEAHAEEMSRELAEKTEEITNVLQRKIKEESSQRRHFEEKAQELEESKRELQGRVEELEEESDHLKRLALMESEAKNKLRQETSHLTAENMDFEEQLDQRDRLIKKLQNQIRSLEISQKAKQTSAPAIPKDYLGMLEYKREDEARLIQNIIWDLKPKGVVVNMIPGLPAYILFMCVRHADYLNDEAKLKSLMNASISAVKKVVMSHHKDFEMLSFWLSNTYQLLNCLKQYSGEEEFMKQNTPRQKKNCLQNFDLSEHRQIISDLAIHIYHQFISVMEKTLAPAIVPGMLEHESLQGISSMKPTGFRKRSNSILEDSETHTISSIVQQLSILHLTMTQHGMEQDLIKQAVKQLFFLVGATTLNNIMLRKDMCSCRKGMQIRCNISYLEEWLKEKELQSSNAMDTLKPLSQAAWLLQVNKSTDDDAKEITEKCTELNSVQIVKILNSYTPIDDFEKRVSSSFVRKVQSLLQDRDGSTQLMLDSDYRFQVTFPFCPSSQALELLQVPSSLHLAVEQRGAAEDAARGEQQHHQDAGSSSPSSSSSSSENWRSIFSL
ncbi:hypothetical protein L3Q82_007236 [Scortum barcoo]|uniref:Uncharacterized protein n=1 Tax=Scortum barcoo TaxID=214431 RepID=A0ACB8WSV7_9TELE|nr:hypothetical protein L3Q82_007236 [Scortum barcoo]